MPINEQESDLGAAEAHGSQALVWLRAAVKWKGVMWSTTLAVLGTGLLAALVLPGRFTATVVMMPPQAGGASSSGAMMAQLSGVGALASSGGGLGIKNPNDQQVALLKSRTVEDALVERFHLRQVYRRRYLSTARHSWESHTQVDNGLKDGLIHLSVTDRDPLRAAQLANGWVEEYRRFSATLAITEAAQRRLFYERQLAIAHADLTQAEDDLKQTEKRTGVMDVEGQGRTMIASAAILRGQLAAKQVEIRAMREFAADENPDLERAEQERAGLEAQLAAMDTDSDRKSGDLVAPRGSMTQAGLDYARALREVKYRETIQDLLTRQYEGARVDEARQGALVQVVDPAVVPDKPSYAYKFWAVAAAFLLALPLGLLAARGADAFTGLLALRKECGSWAATAERLWGEPVQQYNTRLPSGSLPVGAD